jgi:hypothetical protein
MDGELPVGKNPIDLCKVTWRKSKSVDDDPNILDTLEVPLLRICLSVSTLVSVKYSGIYRRWTA